MENTMNDNDIFQAFEKVERCYSFQICYYIKIFQIVGMSAALDTSGGAAEESGGVPGTGEKTVDREKTCPLLLRVFTSYHRHNRLDEFERGEQKCS